MWTLISKLNEHHMAWAWISLCTVVLADFYVYLLASGAVMLVPGVIGSLLLPMMANALSKGRDVAGRRFVASTTYLTLLAAPLVAFGAVYSEPIISFMYGSAYATAASVFAA